MADEVETIPIDEQIARVGRLYGTVYPPAPEMPSPTDDPRTVGLKALRKFIGDITFRIRGQANTTETVPFKIPLERIFVEQPDNVVDGEFASIVFLPGRGVYDYFGLGPPKIIDGSENQFAPGTALIIPGEYIETIILEAWASKIPERRAIVAGIEAHMLREETSTVLRMILGIYYNQVASYSLEARENIDDNESARNRRRVHLSIEMRVPIAQLVSVKTLQPYILDPDY